MQRISKDEKDAEQLLSLFAELGRRTTFRDPLASVFEELGLTPPQIHSIVWLGLDGPLTMGGLARRLCITDKTVTGVVDRLERAGIVRRDRDSADRRVVRVLLTGVGEDHFRTMHAEMVRKVTGLLGFLQADERTVLVRVLERAVAALAPTAPPEEP